MINMIFGISAAKTKRQKEAQRLLNKKMPLCCPADRCQQLSFLFRFSFLRKVPKQVRQDESVSLIAKAL